MKKTFLYTTALVASLVLAACDGDYDDWADPTTIAAEDAVSQYGVTVAAGPEATTVMPDEDGTVQLVSLTASSEDIEDFAVRSLTINGEEMDAELSDGCYITVDAEELSKLVETQNNSRAAVARSLEVVSDVSVVLESGDAIYIGESTTTGSFTPAATPDIDEAGYYLLGDWQSWDLTYPTWMTDNGDGTYTATVTTTSSGSNWYKFYMGSYYSSSDWDVVNQGQMGCEENGDDSMSGFIVYEGDPLYADGVQTPTITGEGTFEITIDMNNLTYTIERAESRYYIVGNINNPTWDSSACLETMFYAEGGNVYSYTTKWQNSWDLKIWDYNDIGTWDAAWGTEVDGDDSYSGTLINSSANSFEAPSAEYYTLTIDMGSQTYYWTYLDDQNPTEYTSMSIIGDFNSWGGDIDLAEEVNAPHNWYARITLDTDGGLKFRANYAWDINWGAEESDLTIGDTYYGTTARDGNNITVPAGTYDFYLNDITGMWNIVPVE